MTFLGVTASGGRMRSGLVFVAIILISASVPVLAAPSSTLTTVAHAAIGIASDADFTAANGVVAGTGTPADPYVIAGWRFSSGSGISIHDTSASWVVRGNFFDSASLLVSRIRGPAVIEQNVFRVASPYSILLTDASPVVRDNAFGGTGSAGIAIRTSNSFALVANNTFNEMVNAVYAESGGLNITGNDIHQTSTGIYARLGVNVNVTANVLTDCDHDGIRIEYSTLVTIADNRVTECMSNGVSIYNIKDVSAVNNSIQLSGKTGIWIESSSGNVSANVVIDGRADGIDIWHSPLLISHNNITNNLGVAIYAKNSAADVQANFIATNSLGWEADDLDASHLTDNVFVNNTVGLDIGYASRQSIPHLSGNFVNGVNVDGSVVASDQVYFYHASNVTITGTRDSGFSAGYFGSLTAQGAVVLYDVDTATITAAISHHEVGVMAYNAFNVNVAGSVLVNNGVGVEAYGTGGVADYVDSYGNHVGAHVPPCVVTVKNTTINVTVDPVGSIGVDAHACLVNVRDSAIDLVSTGIQVDSSSTVSIANVTVTRAQVGLSAIAAQNGLNVTRSAFVRNDVGARLTWAQGAEITSSAFSDNRFTGMVLDVQTSLKSRANSFDRNGDGLVDAKACNGSHTCSSIDSAGDSFSGNQHDGIRMHGAATLRNATLDGNGGMGASLASATLLGTRATRNGLDGAAIVGNFAVRDSVFDGNARNGLAVTGTGELRRSAFTNNQDAGIRAFTVAITAFDLDVSHNFDGIQFNEVGVSLASPTVPVVGLEPVWDILSRSVALGPDPLDIHHSTLVGNERDAIRAGGSSVNATSNYWGSANGPSISVADQVGAFQNGVSPGVRFMPYYTDPTMTTAKPQLLA